MHVHKSFGLIFYGGKMKFYRSNRMREGNVTAVYTPDILLCDMPTK